LHQIGQAKERLGIPRQDPQYITIMALGLLQPPLAGTQDTEIVKRVRVTWVFRQRGLIGRGGSVEPSRTMVIQGGGERGGFL